MHYLVIPVVYVLDKRSAVTTELNVNFALTAAANIHTLLNNSCHTVYLLLLGTSTKFVQKLREMNKDKHM